MVEKRFNRRKERVRRKIRAMSGNKLRLSVFKSNLYIYAQVIDDRLGYTIAQASSNDKVLAKDIKRPSTIEAAAIVGKALAERSLKAGVKEVVFDRGAYKYHGCIKALADSAREYGLVF